MKQFCRVLLVAIAFSAGIVIGSLAIIDSLGVMVREAYEGPHPPASTDGRP